MIFEVPIDHFPLNSNKPSSLAQRRSGGHPPAITISRVDTQMEALSPSGNLLLPFGA